MVSNDTKENNLRESMFGRMHLTAKNEPIARQYLNMDNEENPALLEQVHHQDLSSLFPMNGYAEYLKWLHKNKRTEELSRYVRFVVEVGGSTAWRILANDNYDAKLADLESMFTYLTGEHAEEQKMAIRAELCAKELCKDGSTDDTKTLCQLGKENPDIYLHALDYCHVLDKTNSRDTRHARMLLTAIYLNYKEAGTEPELTKELLKDLLAEIPNITAPAKAFSGSEIQSLQNYVRTAQKETPFPQSVLSICITRRDWVHDGEFLAGCAFLALWHSVHFEILFRLTLARKIIYKNCIEALDTARAISEDDDFHAKMDEIEEMIPILDEDYIIWCLYGYPSTTAQRETTLMECRHAECEAEIRRMAVKCPDGIRAAVQKADSEEYKKLTELVQSANPALYEEIHASYQDVFREKLALELVKWHFKQCEEATKQYLLGKCPLDALLPNLEQCERSDTGSLWRGDYERLNHLKALGEFSFYRRAVILEALKGAPDFFEMYSVSEEIQEKSTDNSILYDKKQILGIFQIFTEENVPIGLQLGALGSICDNIYEKQDRILFQKTCVEMTIKRQQEQDQEQWEKGLMEALRQGGASTCCICLKVLEQYESLDKFKEPLFAAAENGVDQVQKQLLELIKKHNEWDADILAMLASKKQKTRGFAIMVLEEWSNPAHLEEIKAALAKEKNRKLAAQLQALAEELVEAGAQGSQQKQFKRTEEKLAADIY
ncbi:MAG: hypothetical protein K2G55_10110, partial [Lachnospiraceae bacterium]|nr:hypothetical protein [Lachnospiraceae bacterium]